MIRIKTNDDRVFTGETAADVVRAMNAGPDAADADVTRSMWQMAQRAKTYSGEPVSAASPEAFLRGLIRAGLATLEEGTIE